MTYIVTGHYGSGKTEFVLNLARRLAAEGRVTIADLDVINPFFRSREWAAKLAPLGIEVMGSALDNNTGQDIPALSFAFLSRIRAGENVIIDLAGGENGLKLLTNCHSAINNYRFFCVFNMYRPETNTSEKMIEFCQMVNAQSPLKLTGLVNNGNLLALTEGEHVLGSQGVVLVAGKALRLPLKYTLVQADIYAEIADKVLSEKVLTFVVPLMREAWQG